MFWKSLDWKKFAKLVIPVILFLMFVTFADPKIEWWVAPTIIGLWILVLFLNTYTVFIMRPKPKMTLKRLRMMKLKKIRKKC